MKKIFLSIILLVLTSLSAYSTNWMQTGYKQYIDKDTAFIDSNGITDFWIKNLNKGNMPTIKNKKIWYTLNHYYINCNNRTIMEKEIIAYDLKGNLLDSDDGLLSRYNTIAPDTVATTWYNLLCPVSNNY